MFAKSVQVCVLHFSSSRKVCILCAGVGVWPCVFGWQASGIWTALRQACCGQVVSVPRMGISPLQWRTGAVGSTSPAWNDAHVFDFNCSGEPPTLRLEVPDLAAIPGAMDRVALRVSLM